MKKQFIQEGANLPAITRGIRQENINAYAKASRDFNPIHLDENFAGKTAFGGTIAHGMLILAIASEMLTETFGKHWLIGGKLDVRFKSAARPGDTINVNGQITKVEKIAANTTLKISIICANQNNEVILSGDARLTIPN